MKKRGRWSKKKIAVMKNLEKAWAARKKKHAAKIKAVKTTLAKAAKPEAVNITELTALVNVINRGFNGLTAAINDLEHAIVVLPQEAHKLGRMLWVDINAQRDTLTKEGWHNPLDKWTAKQDDSLNTTSSTLKDATSKLDYQW